MLHGFVTSYIRNGFLVYPAQLCVCVAPREQYQRKVCPIRCAFYWCRNQAVVVQASICPVHPPSCSASILLSFRQVGRVYGALDLSGFALCKLGGVYPCFFGGWR